MANARLVVSRGADTVWTTELGEKGSATFGSDPKNIVRLNDPAVAAFALRIEWDGMHAFICNLAAADSVIIDGYGVLPNFPEEWNFAKPIQIGPFALTLSLVKSPAPQRLDSAVSMHLEVQQVTITPGEPVFWSALLNNSGIAAIPFLLEVDGVPPEWVQGPADNWTLNPGAEAKVLFTIKVPKIALSSPGNYSVTLRAVSPESKATLSTVASRWTVLPFAKVGVVIAPQQVSAPLRADYKVAIQNEGNASAQFVVESNGGDQSVARLFKTNGGLSSIWSTGPIEPKASLECILDVSAPKQWVGGPRSYPFNIEARDKSSGVVAEASAVFVQRATIPVWALAIVAVVLTFAGYRLVPSPVPQPEPQYPKPLPAPGDRQNQGAKTPETPDIPKNETAVSAALQAADRCVQAHDLTCADAEFKTVLKIDPGNRNAQVGLRKMEAIRKIDTCSSTGDVNCMEMQAKQLQQLDPSNHEAKWLLNYVALAKQQKKMDAPLKPPLKNPPVEKTPFAEPDLQNEKLRSPREVCADRPNFVSVDLCEFRLCKKHEYQTHPYCVKLRERESSNQFIFGGSSN